MRIFPLAKLHVAYTWVFACLNTLLKYSRLTALLEHLDFYENFVLITPNK